MIVNPIKTNQVTFGYSNPLKTEWLKGNLPSVKYGFYGDILTKKNVSLEHLKPRSQGGTSMIDNFVLATKENNQKRGAEDIRFFATRDDILMYLFQFSEVKTNSFEGNSYIHSIIKTLDKLGIKIGE